MPFDLFCGGLVVLFAIVGAVRGFIRQIFGLLGFAGGVLLARLAAPAFGEAFGKDLHLAPAIATAALAFLLFIAAEIVARTLGRIVHQQLGGGVAGGLNRVGGSWIGAGKGVLVIWALASLVALVRPHLPRVEHDTPVAKLRLDESFAVATATKSNLITELRKPRDLGAYR
ncbi:MAG: CvpA family protein [Myxococcales bacterium]|nr:CvpA family protein [Myxococcales bacterium]